MALLTSSLSHNTTGAKPLQQANSTLPLRFLTPSNGSTVQALLLSSMGEENELPAWAQVNTTRRLNRTGSAKPGSCSKVGCSKADCSNDSGTVEHESAAAARQRSLDEFAAWDEAKHEDTVGNTLTLTLTLTLAPTPTLTLTLTRTRRWMRTRWAIR